MLLAWPQVACCFLAVLSSARMQGAAPDKEAALAAWEQGRKSFNQYVKVLNKGMTSQVTPAPACQC